MLELLKKYPKYLFVIEESALAEDPEFVKKNIGDYIILICRYGYLYQYSKTHLCLVANSDRRIKTKLEKIQELSILANGDDELSCIFPKVKFKEVKKVVRPLFNEKSREAIKKRFHGKLKKC